MAPTNGEWDWAAARAICLREARRVLGRTADAEDAAQEAALRAWRKHAECAGQREGWLATIGRREALRLAGARATIPLDSVAEPAEASHADGALDRVDLRRAVAELSAARPRAAVRALLERPDPRSARPNARPA